MIILIILMQLNLYVYIRKLTRECKSWGFFFEDVGFY